jgi:hypothetical protein
VEKRLQETSAKGVGPSMKKKIFSDAVRIPVESKDYSSNLCVQTGSGAHPASCAMGTGGPFPRGSLKITHQIST